MLAFVKHFQMLDAINSPSFRFCFLHYIRFLLRRNFHSVNISGELEAVRQLRQGGGRSVIFYSNHQTWWDGFLEVPLLDILPHEIRLVMDERNLRRYPYFRFLGVVGVDPDCRRDGARLLRNLSVYLNGSGSRPRAVILYPQGRLVPPLRDEEPFRKGIASLLKLSPSSYAIPVFKRIIMEDRRKPIAYLEVGTPIAGTTLPTAMTLKAALDSTGTIQRERIRTPSRSSLQI